MAKIRFNLGKNSKSISVGALLIYIGIGVLFVAMTIQFSYLMIFKSLDNEDLVAHGENRFSRTQVTEAERGEILDRHGEVIASNMESFRLALITDDTFPNHVSDPEIAAEEISNIIDMPKKEIKERIENGIENERFQVEFGRAGRDLSFEQKRSLETSNIGGVYLTSETKRFYPNGNFASHIVGYTEVPEGSEILTGQLGVERAFNEQLQGENGSISYNEDLWGYMVPNSSVETHPHDGMNVELTIDSNIQIYLEDSLDEMQEHFEPEELFAYVMDAKTGEILASGQRPSFNPATREGMGGNWLNMLHQYSFEPGSTFKIFGLAGAIDAGVYDPNETFMSGSFDVNGHTIYDWEPSGWGRITFNEGLQYSSNVVMMLLQDKVGEDEMLDYYKKFGFGQETGFDLPGEVSGTILWEEEIHKKTTSFGQTSTVTPIQMLQATTAIFNDGVMKKPYVIKKVSDSNTNEIVYEGHETEVDTVISKEAARQTHEQLNTLVGGSMERNTQYEIEGYEVSGKSGTAQVINPDGGGYITEPYQTLTSFIGYAPKEDPEVVVYYGVKLASKNKADTWHNGVMHGFNPLMERTLQYLNVRGETLDEMPEPINVENYIGENVNEVNALNEERVNAFVVGNGEEIVDQFPKGGTLYPFEQLFIITEGADYVPDLTNLSKREIYILADMLNITIKTTGEGFVTTQSTAPGTIINEDTVVEVSLESLDPNE